MQTKGKTVKVLKAAVNLVAKPLTLKYNASLEKGISPRFGNLARVTPIYRTGLKTDVRKHRPISVLSTVSRILKTIVLDQLLEYLTGCNKLCLNLFAFQRLHNTVTCLLNVKES